MHAAYISNKKALGAAMRICDLKKKEVINICDGQRIGCIIDVEFDLCNCCITHIIVPGPCKMFGMFGREEEYVISVSCIKQIGSDVVLVEANLEKCLNKCKWL